MKPWYDLLTSSEFYYETIFSLIILFIPFIGYFIYIVLRFLEFILIQSIILSLLGIMILIVVEPTRKYLFPKVFFLLGRQKRKMQVIQQHRKWLFEGIIFAIIIGVISNIIYSNLFPK